MSNQAPALASRLTIGISSFERPEALLRLVGSIRRFYPDVPIIVVDDSSAAVQESVCRLLSPITGVDIVTTVHDVGLSEKRNIALRLCQTELFCLCDDDFVFTAATKLELLVAAVDAGCDLAAGEVGDTTVYRHRFERRGTVLFTHIVDPKMAPTFGGYPLYDLLLNFFLGRTAALRAVPWNPVLKLHEHDDWFMRAQHLRKTQVPACRIEHIRDGADDYNAKRQAQVKACKEVRRELLRERGLTYFVADSLRIVSLAKPPKREEPEPKAPPLTVAELAALVNPVGPKSQHKRPAPPRPPRRPPVVPPVPVTLATLPTTRMFMGLPSGTPLPPADLVAGRWPHWLRRALRHQRVLVVGSAPRAYMPDARAYDVILTVNGGMAHVARDEKKPVIAVINEGGLGCVSDAYTPHAALLDTYAGRRMDGCVILPYVGWTDYHDPLTATWWTRAERDVLQLTRRGALFYQAPIGLTPAGRDRLIAAATGGVIVHAAQPNQPSTWHWRTSGWSAGLLAACLAYAGDADSVCLAGMSGEVGHVHADLPRDVTYRGHLDGDKAVLRAALAHDAGRWSTTVPSWARTTGLRLVDSATLPVVLRASADRGGA